MGSGQARRIRPAPQGGTTPAILLPSKQGDIYVLDCATGESLTPMGEIEAPDEGGVEPDFLSPTQAVSEWHRLRKDDLVERDMWAFTPLTSCGAASSSAAPIAKASTPRLGRPALVQYPGYNGGSDWGSVAIDTDRGTIVANDNDIPNYNRLLPRKEVEPGSNADVPPDSRAEGESGPQAGAPYGIDVNAGWRNDVTGVPCTRPPYGRIRAIDLNTGETLWDTPIGTARCNGPFGIPSMLPFRIGTPNKGGSVVTAGGLVFIAAATDNLLRAIDVGTGETVWQDVLPGGGQASPISHEVGGRQHVLIAATGHHSMETPIGDHIVACRLPD